MPVEEDTSRLSLSKDAASPAHPPLSLSSNSKEEDDDDPNETDDDNELRDLVTTALKENGTLGKIKAQLRASVYNALQQQGHKRPQESGDRLRDYVKTSDGRLLLQLVRELLSCFELKFTLSVFDQEIGGCGDAVAARSREDLVEILGLRELLSKRESPVLSEILRLSKVSVLKSETPTPTAGQSTEDEDESSAALSSIDSNVGLPMSSNNNGGGRLTTGEKDAVTKSNSTSKGPNITSSPDSREGLSLTPSSKPSSSLGDLPSLSKPQTSSSSLLGNLPALGGGGGNSQGGRRTLAPLKKPPPPAATAVQQIPSAPAPAASKPPPPAAQPAPPKPGPTPPAEAEEASLSEVIDEELDFEDSTSTENGGRADKEEKNSVSDHTRDETASENESLRVDYAEAI